MSKQVRISDPERRARLVARHHLATTAPDAKTAVQGLTAVHSSDPITPFLALRARVVEFTISDLEVPLYESRELWRLHAMRRTLWVVPAEDAGMFLAATGHRIAARERDRLTGWVSAALEVDEVEAWIAETEEQTLGALEGEVLVTRELAERVGRLTTELEVGSGKWSTTTPLSSRLLYLLAMDGRILRARPAGSWRSSQYQWVRTDDWFGSVADRWEPSAARVELVRRYLISFGPATELDVRWWSGLTATEVRAALAELDAVPVELEGAGAGYLLTGDAPAAAEVPRHVSFLPGLDPTPMGWKQREWYLGGYEAELFDRNGNVGPTIWVDGRVVGGWGQRPDGTVAFTILDDDGDSGLVDRVQAEARAVEGWLDGEVVSPRFRTPLERRLTTA